MRVTDTGGMHMSVKKITVLFLVFILSTGLLSGCATQKSDEKAELLVSAAASMTDVLGELKEVYEAKEKNVILTYTFGSSGALQAQIEEGAPVDIFISAAQKQMTVLEEGGLLVEGTKKTLLQNKVVLIVPSNSDLGLTSFEDMTKDEVKKIGLGEPAGVPVGQYTEEILKNLNILDEVNAKTVFGSDVRTVLTWVENGEVDCGVVYATDAASTDKVKVITEAPEGSHKEVTYPVAVIKDSKNIEASKAFLDFLTTDEAKKIFEKHGFAMK